MKVKQFLKSIHFWGWLIFILWVLFVYYYPRKIAVYDDWIDKVFAPMEWLYIYFIGAIIWFWFYMFFAMKEFKNKYNK